MRRLLLRQLEKENFSGLAELRERAGRDHIPGSGLLLESFWDRTERVLDIKDKADRAMNIDQAQWGLDGDWLEDVFVAKYGLTDQIAGLNLYLRHLDERTAALTARIVKLWMDDKVPFAEIEALIDSAD
jgi:hypothetical protein